MTVGPKHNRDPKAYLHRVHIIAEMAEMAEKGTSQVGITGHRDQQCMDKQKTENLKYRLPAGRSGQFKSGGG